MTLQHILGNHTIFSCHIYKSGGTKKIKKFNREIKTHNFFENETKNLKKYINKGKILPWAET